MCSPLSWPRLPENNQIKASIKAPGKTIAWRFLWAEISKTGVLRIQRLPQENVAIPEIIDSPADRLYN